PWHTQRQGRHRLAWMSPRVRSCDYFCDACGLDGEARLTANANVYATNGRGFTRPRQSWKSLHKLTFPACCNAAARRFFTEGKDYEGKPAGHAAAKKRLQTSSLSHAWERVGEREKFNPPA